MTHCTTPTAETTSRDMNNRYERRYGYLMPACLSGVPPMRKGQESYVDFLPSDVVHATRWVDTYGNPTTKLYFDTGSAIVCVDDHGAMNGIPITPTTVRRRKDL